MDDLQLIYPPITDYYTQAETNNLVNNAGYVTPATLTTISGDVITYIDSRDNWLHSHLDQTLTTVSGDIITQIPSLTSYVTLTKLTTTSGDIVSQIPSLAGYATQAWSTSTFYTQAQITTISGNIVAQIPSLAGYATQAWANSTFVTPATLSTVSGNIVAQIPSLAGYATQAWTNSNFYTQSQINTISGNIVAQIPSLSSYATQAWANSLVNTTSGDLRSYIDSRDTTTSGDLVSWVQNQSYVTQAKLTTTSGDIVAQIPDVASYATLANLTTTSGDIVAQIPSVAGYATQSWVNTNFIDTAEMTTISGDLVALMSTVSGGQSYTFQGAGDVTVTTDGSLVTISGATASGGAIYSFLGAGNVVVYENGNDITISGAAGSYSFVGLGSVSVAEQGGVVTISGATTSGGGSLDCAVCDSGYLSVNTGVKFPDGSIATTRQQITGCSGTRYQETFTINYDDVFPKYLFDLPAHNEIIDVSVAISPTFSGGTGSKTYPNLEGVAKVNVSSTAGYTYIHYGEKLRPGATIDSIGIYSTASVTGNKLKLCKKIADYMWQLTNITVSGGAATFTNAAGYHWQKIDRVQVPDDGYDYYAGYYNQYALTYAQSNAGTTWGVARRYWSGDKTGLQPNPTLDTANFPHLQVQYTSAYSLGNTEDNESILEYFYPTTSGITVSGGSIPVGVGWGSTVYSRPLHLYRSAVSPDADGSMQVTVDYARHCFEEDFATITGGGNVWVERDGLNHYTISSLDKCYDTECIQTVSIPMTGVTDTQRIFVLPASHQITSISGTTNVVGGSETTAGYSGPGVNYGYGGNLTFVIAWHNLTNGSVINQVWIYSEVAQTFKLKMAKKLTTDADYFIEDICSISHPGGGERNFQISPTTITGVAGDVFRLALYSPDNFSRNRYTYGTGAGYFVSGDLVGTRTAMTADITPPSIRVGYHMAYNIGTTNTDLIMVPPSGVFSYGSYGPVYDNTPLYLYPSSSFMDYPPSGGAIDVTIRYNNPSYMQTTMGTATWSGLDGSRITHNMATISHFLFVSPVDQNPGAWWVQKGLNQDLVYSDTLSGTGTFDWWIKK